jgi:hypothetical protein
VLRYKSGINKAIGGITVDILTSDSQNVLDSVLKGFSKTPLEVFWNFELISICFCRAQHPRRTFKSYPERDTFADTELPCQLMAKAAVAQPSLSPSPTKLLEAKLLVVRAEQKAKGKKKRLLPRQPRQPRQPRLHMWATKKLQMLRLLRMTLP